MRNSVPESLTGTEVQGGQGVQIGELSPPKGCAQADVPIVREDPSFLTDRGFLAGFLMFLITLFYLMSQAIDLFLFHFVVDIHLPVVAMIVMFTGLSIVNGRSVTTAMSSFKSLLAIIVLWSGYLLLNGILGENLQTSIVLLCRFVGSWLIAFHLGIFLHRGGKWGWSAISLALLVSFFLITLIWYLQSIDVHLFAGLQPKVRNPSAIRDWGALYVNPNVLGFVMVAHAATAIWFMLQSLLSLVLIPLVWLSALFGVVQSRSTNAFIGILMVGAFALFAYYKVHSNQPSTRRHLKLALPVFICIAVIGLSLLGKAKLDRVLDRAIDYRKTTYGWLVPEDGLSGEQEAKIARIYDEERQSYVIDLSGSGLPKHYLYELDEMATSQNSGDGVAEWSMKFSEPFIITISVRTTKGTDELLYTPPGMFVPTVYEAGLAFELDSGVDDGRWHTIRRDLNKDLQKGLPEAEVLEVTAFMVRGNARIDDIKIGNRFQETFDGSDPNLIHDLKKAVYQIDKTRMQIWKRSLDYWREKPITGIGLGSFQYKPAEKRFFHAHSFLLTLLVEQGLIGFMFLTLFCATLVYQMRSWVGVSLLACFFFSQLFEDEALQFCLPIYLSFMLGYCFQFVLRRQNELPRNDPTIAEPK